MVSQDVRGFIAGVRPHYRTLRRLGLGRAYAARAAMTPDRLSAASAALHGHPVAYRLQIRGGLVLDQSGAYLSQCRIEERHP